MHESRYKNLINHLSNTHNLILLDQEIQEIENELKKDLKQLTIHSVVKSFYCHYRNVENAPKCKKSCAFCKDKEKELQ